MAGDPGGDVLEPDVIGVSLLQSDRPAKQFLWVRSPYQHRLFPPPRLVLPEAQNARRAFRHRCAQSGLRRWHVRITGQPGSGFGEAMDAIGNDVILRVAGQIDQHRTTGPVEQPAAVGTEVG